MKAKLLITVRGGNIQSIYSSIGDVKVIVLDYDNIDAGDEPAKELYPINIVENMYELFTDANDPQEVEIRENLKRIHF